MCSVANVVTKAVTRTAFNVDREVYLKTTILVAALGLGLALSASAQTVVYNNIPVPQPGNVASEGFEADSDSEFGGIVQLASYQRQNPRVTVFLSSWGCQAGHWYSGDCVSSPGSTFSVPLTLNIYNVGAGNTVGSLIATSTQTFNVPYRPSADAVHCTNPGTDSNGGNDVGKWYSASENTCYSGAASSVTFSALSGVTLPDVVIVTVAFNTSHHGYQPVGESAPCYSTSGGCGYDSLNVGLSAPPSVGSNPIPDEVFVNATWGHDPNSAYCDNGTTGVLRLSGACWEGYQPAIAIAAQYINPPASADSCKKYAWQTLTRADGSFFKNQGDCVSYVQTGK